MGGGGGGYIILSVAACFIRSSHRTGPAHSPLSHPENISFSYYESRKIYLIYTPGFVLQKRARYEHGGRLQHAAQRCHVR